MTISIKNKSLLTVLLFVLLLLSIFLFACTPVQFDNSVYEPVVKEYKDAVLKCKGSMPKTWDMSKIDYNGKISGYEYIVVNSNLIPEKFLYRDLNNDGVNELIIANTEFVSNIYSIVNQQIKLIYLGKERDNVNLLEDNLLLAYGSGGYDFGEITLNKLKPIKNYSDNDSMFDVIEGIRWNGFDTRSSNMAKFENLGVNSSVVSSEYVENANLYEITTSYYQSFNIVQESEWNPLSEQSKGE